MWSLESTYLGRCLVFDPEKAINVRRKRNMMNSLARLKEKLLQVSPANSLENRLMSEDELRRQKSLRMTIGLNRTDRTFGWRDGGGAYTIHYVSTTLQNEFSMVNENSHPLVPGLCPLVTFQIQTTKYLGPPYTQCNATVGYSQKLCEFIGLQQQIVNICSCVPDYVPNVRELVGDPNIKVTILNFIFDFQ